MNQKSKNVRSLDLPSFKKSQFYDVKTSDYHNDSKFKYLTIKLRQKIVKSKSKLRLHSFLTVEYTDDNCKKQFINIYYKLHKTLRI